MARPRPGQHFDQVHGPHRGAGLAQPSADVHQAPGIAGHHHRGAAGLNGLDLGLHHGPAHLGVDHAEHAAKAAAGLLSRERDQLQALHLSQELLGLLADTQPAQQVTGGVVGHLVGEAGPHAGYLQLVGQELGELEGACAHLDGALVLWRTRREQVRVEVANHVHAGPGRRDDVAVGATERVQPSRRHRPRLGPETAVVEGLAATGLLSRKSNLNPEPFQQPHHLVQDSREELLGQAGDEQARLGGHTDPFRQGSCSLACESLARA